MQLSARGPLGALGFAALLVLTGGARAEDDIVLRAMCDEMARSMQQLQLEKLEKPYFIAYRVHEKQTAAAAGSFGALIQSGSSRSRFLTVEVRVGNPKLDNTNFVSLSFLNSGGLAGGFGGGIQLPLEDNYNEIRRQLWLATDSAYKKAVEDLSRKKAALENRTNREDIRDLSTERPATMAEARTPLKPAISQLEDLARNLSAKFRATPTIDTDSARVTVEHDYVRYVNSEGSTFTRNTPVVNLVLTVGTQASDGTALRDSISVVGRSIGDLPPLPVLESRAHAMGERLEKLRAAPAMDRYNGPVLFTGQAAAELFSQVIAPALLCARRPLSAEPQFDVYVEYLSNPYQDQLGRRVLPFFMSVVDDPTLSRFQGESLLGGIRVDDDGVPARRTVLVEKGTLKTLLATRTPVTGVAQSTGSRHGGVAAPSNMLVSVQPGVPKAALKAKLIGMVKQQGLPFGVIIERIVNPLADPSPDGIASLMSRIMPGQGGGGAPRMAVLAYKIFPDGHQELVRNVAINGVTPASFKDVVAASAEPEVYNTSFFSVAHSMFAFFSGGSPAEAPAQPVSFVVPSMLFDDITLKWPLNVAPKLPISPRPVGY